MSRIWVVRKGRHFWGKTTTVYASSDYRDCERWIYENIQKHDHMYIEEVERLDKATIREMFENSGLLKGGNA